MPKTDPNTVIPTGEHTRTQYLIRATFPDGTIRDSGPHDHAVPLGEAFGRLFMPKGTTTQRLRRTVTVIATEWEPAADAQDTNSSEGGN
jgi:hypothetical protein